MSGSNMLGSGIAISIGGTVQALIVDCAGTPELISTPVKVSNAVYGNDTAAKVAYPGETEVGDFTFVIRYAKTAQTALVAKFNTVCVCVITMPDGGVCTWNGIPSKIGATTKREEYCQSTVTITGGDSLVWS